MWIADDNNQPYYGKSLEGVDDSLAQPFSAMAQEYFDLTGKRVKLNSARRTRQRQEEIYATARPGYAAKPGRSPHEHGYALDIHSVHADELEEMGLLEKYGLHRPFMGHTKSGIVEPWHIEPVGSQFRAAGKVAGQVKKVPGEPNWIVSDGSEDQAVTATTQGGPNWIVSDGSEGPPAPRETALIPGKKELEDLASQFLVQPSAKTIAQRRYQEPIEIGYQAEAGTPPAELMPQEIVPQEIPSRLKTDTTPSIKATKPEEYAEPYQIGQSLAEKTRDFNINQDWRSKMTPWLIEGVIDTLARNYAQYQPGVVAAMGTEGPSTEYDPREMFPGAREERYASAVKDLRSRWLPEGPTLPRTFGEQILKGVVTSLPAFVELWGYGRLGAAMGLSGPALSAFSFGGLGATDPEHPVKGAISGAALGGVLGGMHKLTGMIEAPVKRWAARITGGAGIGGGAAAIGGGGPEEIAHQATLFALFETVGLPKGRSELKKFADKLGLTEKEVVALAWQATRPKPNLAEMMAIAKKSNLPDIVLPRKGIKWEARPELAPEKITEPPVAEPVVEPAPTPEPTNEALVAAAKNYKKGAPALTGDDLAILREAYFAKGEGTFPDWIDNLAKTEPVAPATEPKAKEPWEMTLKENELNSERKANIKETIPDPADIVNASKKGTIKLYSGGPEWADVREMARNAENAISKMFPEDGVLASSKRGLLKHFFPGAGSPEARQAAEILGHGLGSHARESKRAVQYLKRDKEMFQKEGVDRADIPLLENIGVQISSDISMGRDITDTRFKMFARRVDTLFKRALQNLEDAGVPLETVREHYFPGMWTRQSRRAFNLTMEEYRASGNAPEEPDLNLWEPQHKEAVRTRTEELLGEGKGSDKDYLQHLSRRPLEGSKAFKKQKVFDDYRTAVEFGLKPTSNNPVDIVLYKLEEINKFAMVHKAIREFKDAGGIKFYPVGKLPPEGMIKIDDPWGRVTSRNDAGEIVVRGNYYATKEVSNILNNYLSQSLYNWSNFGPAFKRYMQFANLLNQAQLGLGSLFHGSFTALETQISAGAEVLKDIYGWGKGNRTKDQLGETLARYPFAMGGMPKQGGKVMAEYYRLNSDVPVDIPVGQLTQDPQGRLAILAKAMEVAGGKVGMQNDLITHSREKMLKEFRAGNYGKAAMSSPVALLEWSQHWLLGQFVPRQKVGLFAELAGRILEQNPGKSLEELRGPLRDAWTHVDARLGQVFYTRYFMDNTAKNVVQALIRAPGWTGGTLFEVGGSIPDTIKFVKEWVSTGKAPENIPDRTAYTLSLLFHTMVANSALTWALTGDDPRKQSWKDFWAFRDGTRDRYGNSNRWMLPTYGKDIWGYGYDLPTSVGTTLMHKTHPALSAALQFKEGKDYYNTAIRDKNADYITQLGQLGVFGVKQFVPFWMRGVGKSTEAETVSEIPGKIVEHPVKTALPLAGIMPATRSMTQTSGQKEMEEYYASQGQKVKSPAEAALARDRAKAGDLIRQGKNKEAIELIKPHFQAKELNLQDVKRWITAGQKLPQDRTFDRMPIDWQLRVLKKAEPEERARWEKILLKDVATKLQANDPKIIPWIPKVREYFNRRKEAAK